MKLKKEITFIYMDTSEKQQFEPIMKEAQERGYKVKLTKDKFEKCEIGFYCQHINFPENSKFSIIMLHDIIQGFGNWPNIWQNEPWNKYDIGILPGKKWSEMWEKSSSYYYTRTKRGVYSIGWPKADYVKSLDFKVEKTKRTIKYNLNKDKPTILYAPAWENDNKQDDFVQAMKKLDVNILIKQADMNKELFPKSYKRIEEMKELHRNVEGVYQLPHSTNIMEAIMMCDILVSEESSTMAEAVLLGKPAVSVSDWLIPDVIPSRFPSVDYDFVIKTKISNLSNTIEKVLRSYDKYVVEAKEYSKKNFDNLGYASEIIMNLIDSIILEKNFYMNPLVSRVKKKMGLLKYINHIKKIFKIRVVNVYTKKSKLINYLYKLYRKGEANI